MNIKIKTNYLKTFSDTHTPVELYLKLRDKYPYCFLLKSSDYKSKENSFSYICFFPIASFKVNKEKTEIQKPRETKKLKTQEINVSIPQNCLKTALNSFLLVTIIHGS